MERNIGLLRAAQRRGAWVFLISIGISLCTSWQNQSYAEVPGPRLGAWFSENVVQVKAKWGGKSREGFGVIFGERDGRLYMATASKLVSGGHGDADRTPSVAFFWSQTAQVRGKLLETPSTASSLAVIEIESAKIPGLRWSREVVAATSSVASDAPVWLGGSSRRWMASPTPGKVRDVIDAVGLIIADGLNAAGAAGAPLISEHGMIGLVVSDVNPKEVEAIPVDSMEASIKNWGLPWDLSVVVPKQNCDRLAASPDDPRKPTDVPGVRLDRMDVKKARLECSLLGSFAEKIPRFAFQAGRIFQSEGDLQEAEKLYAIAAKNGYPAALSALGVLYEMKGKDREAVAFYRRSAEQDDPVGQTNLATMLRDEYGGVQKNDDEAVRLYKKAAGKNYSVALSSLGWMYEQGRAGGSANESEARKLYERAADKGDPYAKRALMRLDSR